MAKFLFSLRNVPDDEAEEVRALLSANDIPFYETSAGNWGISTPAIWLEDEAESERARRLISDYQVERAKTQRAAYEQMRSEGKTKTLFDAVKEQPLRVVFLVLFIGLILYFTVKPFLDLAG